MDDSATSSTVSSAASITGAREKAVMPSKISQSSMSVLDLYSGCGAMSTGLCFGASMSRLNLVTVSYGCLYFALTF